MLVLEALQLQPHASANVPKLVAQRLAEIFDYMPDQERVGESDNWPTRNEVLANIALHSGRLVGDCDDFAFAAAYALHDAGRGARVVTGADEAGNGHMVCEDEGGFVIDSRQPGLLMTWDELERIGYRSARMNGLHFEQHPREWYFVKVDRDGLRVYA